MARDMGSRAMALRAKVRLRRLLSAPTVSGNDDSLLFDASRVLTTARSAPSENTTPGISFSPASLSPTTPVRRHASSLRDALDAAYCPSAPLFETQQPISRDGARERRADACEDRRGSIVGAA